MPSKDTTVIGVIFYPPQYVKLSYQFTARVEDDGKIVGTSAEGTCKQVVQKEEVQVMADLTKPMLISNSSGDMSAAKFLVSLTNGLLASVNAEPTQKPSEVISAVTGGATGLLGALIPKAAVLRPGGRPIEPPTTPACNAAPQLTGFTKVELS